MGKANKLTFSLVLLYHASSCWLIFFSWCTPGSVDSTILLWFFNLHFSWNHNSAHPCFLLLKSRCFFFDPFACWFNPSFYSTKAHVHHLNYHFLDMFVSYITFLLVESPCLLQRCQSAPTRQSSHRGSGRGHRKTCLESKWDNRGVIHQVSWNFPLVIHQFAMENAHLVRWFTYQKWWFFPYGYVKLPEGMLSKWRFLAGKTWKIIYKIGDVRDVHCQVWLPQGIDGCPGFYAIKLPKFPASPNRFFTGKPMFCALPDLGHISIYHAIHRSISISIHPFIFRRTLKCVKGRCLPCCVMFFL